MDGPKKIKVEYYRPDLASLTEWREVSIDGPEGLLRLVGDETTPGMDRQHISIQVGELLYRWAERFWIWECEEFIYIAAEGREEWGGSYLDSIKKFDGRRSRAVLSRQEVVRLSSLATDRPPFIGVSVPNVHARDLGLKKG